MSNCFIFGSEGGGGINFGLRFLLGFAHCTYTGAIATKHTLKLYPEGRFRLGRGGKRVRPTVRGCVSIIPRMKIYCSWVGGKPRVVGREGTHTRSPALYRKRITVDLT